MTTKTDRVNRALQKAWARNERRMKRNLELYRKDLDRIERAHRALDNPKGGK